MMVANVLLSFPPRFCGGRLRLGFAVESFKKFSLSIDLWGSADGDRALSHDLGLYWRMMTATNWYFIRLVRRRGWA
jgi:hypothetical protein